MDFNFKRRTEEKSIKTLQEAFLRIDEKLDKLMQPNEKIHLYTDDDLINFLTKIFDLMGEIEKEMVTLIKIADYPNFKEKCEEFSGLCEEIKEVVDIAIDNLQHFSSFKRLNDLKIERDRGTVIMNKFSISDYFEDGNLELAK